MGSNGIFVPPLPQTEAGEANRVLDGSNSHYKSFLQRTEDNQVHDLICVGFGPAALAIAVALHDTFENEQAQYVERLPKVAFLAKQSCFSWHAGMLLEGATMQISFLKDMATLRNPQSSFTFLNYLHIKNRLLKFSNLETFLPHRIEFEDYLRWCASWFEDVVHYNQEVLEIRPEKISSVNQRVDGFSVVSRNTETGAVTIRKARNVVIASGGRAAIPPPFPQAHRRLMHSSKFAMDISGVLPDRRAVYNIAVVGGGQSAAEIFNSLHDRYPNAQTRLVLKATALKPSDDSPL
jgi:L-ornithine N5-oxygenase